MKKPLVLLLFAFILQATKAQTAQDSVKAVVNRLFAAMKAGDATSLMDCFADSAILQTIDRNGAVQNAKPAGFAALIKTLPKDSADERIEFETVKIDENLALVWAPYRFFYAGKFSHCGVDSFQLVRISGRWKIQYLIDTRRRTACN